MEDEGTPKKKRSWLKTGCLGLIGLFVGLLILGAIVGESNPDPYVEGIDEDVDAGEPQPADEPQLADEPEPVAEQAMEVTSRQLAAAYEANEVAAQQQFSGRALLVTGTVSAVTLDFMDNPVVQLPGVNEFFDVQAQLNDANDAARLQRGQEVRMLCREITEVVSAPMLGDCQLIE